MASITKRGNAYLIRCYAGYTAEGKQITKMMTWHPEPGMLESRAQKEAQRQAVMFEDSIKFGICDNTHIKFQQYAEIWLKDYAEVELAPKTVYDYKHLMPAINAEIGYLYLDKITPTHLIRLRDKLSQAKKETRYTVRGNLKQMLKARGFRTYVALQKASGLCEETIHSVAPARARAVVVPATASAAPAAVQITTQAIALPTVVSVKKLYALLRPLRMLEKKPPPVICSISSLVSLPSFTARCLLPFLTASTKLTVSCSVMGTPLLFMIF